MYISVVGIVYINVLMNVCTNVREIKVNQLLNFTLG